jgi:hypothetical protein
MGEITVLAIAAIGVFVLMRMPRQKKPEMTTEASPEDQPVEETSGA